MITYITRPLRLFSSTKLQSDLWNLTVNGCGSLMKQRLFTVVHQRGETHADIAVVAKNDNVYVGWACLNFDKEPVPKIMLYVQPLYRKKGIGSTLLSRSYKYLQKRGYKTAYAEPWDPHSLQFFSKQGFAQDPSIEFFSAKHEFTRKTKAL